MRKCKLVFEILEDMKRNDVFHKVLEKIKQMLKMENMNLLEELFIVPINSKEKDEKKMLEMYKK